MWGWQPGAAALNSVLFVSQLSVDTGALSPIVTPSHIPGSLASACSAGLVRKIVC
jgi:hypothetical protein